MSANTPSFSTDLFIPFHLADPANIIFYSHLFTLAHQAYEIYVIKHLQLDWKTWFQHPEIILPIKHAEATYHRPLFAGKECTIHVGMEERSPYSFKMHFEFFQDQNEIASVITTHLSRSKIDKSKISFKMLLQPLFKPIDSSREISFSKNIAHNRLEI